MVEPLVLWMRRLRTAVTRFVRRVIRAVGVSAPAHAPQAAIITTAKVVKPPSPLVDAILLGMLFTSVIYAPFAQNTWAATAVSYGLTAVLDRRQIDWRGVWKAAAALVAPK
jgi:hypothetical protein